MEASKDKISKLLFAVPISFHIEVQEPFFNERLYCYLSVI